MEDWKDIEGYDGLYKVSNLGNVYSVRSGRNLKPQTNTTGYLQVPLYYGKKKLHCVHKLVAKAFIQNTNNLPEVNHKDGIKKHCYVDNLEWCNRNYNQKHAHKLGLNKGLKKGENHHKSKLTVDDVKEIRRLYATGMYSQKKIAEIYKINQTNVGFIVRMEIWKDV